MNTFTSVFTVALTRVGALQPWLTIQHTRLWRASRRTLPRVFTGFIIGNQPRKNAPLPVLARVKLIRESAAARTADSLSPVILCARLPGPALGFSLENDA
ncbi:MAG: hypothetical protein PVJ39_17075 [Gammaproteobacteria bacterium]|jgi:hypothetical protein